MLNLEQKLWFTGWWFFVAIIFLHFPIYASLMFDWARSLLGSMPILRWYSQLCCHRRNTTQEPALDPARQTNQEALVPFEADSDAETETGSLPGRKRSTLGFAHQSWLILWPRRPESTHQFQSRGEVVRRLGHSWSRTLESGRATLGPRKLGIRSDPAVAPQRVPRHCLPKV